MDHENVLNVLNKIDIKLNMSKSKMVCKIMIKDNNLIE